MVRWPRVSERRSVRRPGQWTYSVSGNPSHLDPLVAFSCVSAFVSLLCARDTVLFPGICTSDFALVFHCFLLSCSDLICAFLLFLFAGLDSTVIPFGSVETTSLGGVKMITPLGLFGNL